MTRNGSGASAVALVYDVSAAMPVLVWSVLLA
jgi:hypothetical protein